MTIKETITNIGAVGGLVLALGCGGATYTDDVKSFLQEEGWQNVQVMPLAEESSACGGLNFYSVSGRIDGMPKGVNVHGYLCAGLKDGKFKAYFKEYDY